MLFPVSKGYYPDTENSYAECRIAVSSIEGGHYPTSAMVGGLNQVVTAKDLWLCHTERHMGAMHLRGAATSSEPAQGLGMEVNEVYDTWFSQG